MFGKNQMVQIEVSFATHDETVRKQLEFYTHSIAARLKIIEKLAKEDIFVRTMAMPFYGNSKDLDILKTLTFNAGAQAFKHKGLNYYNWKQLKNLTYDDLINDRISRVHGRPDRKNLNYIIKSGETNLIKGKSKSVNLLMPISKARGTKSLDWAVHSQFNNRLQSKTVDKIDCGYSMISKINWGYIV
jgi:DNA repair photolyase